MLVCFFFQAEDGIRDGHVTGVQTCALPICFGDGYGRLVEEVGTRSGSARQNTQAAKSLMEQTQALRDSVSGVNLDEEAANMIKYEQIYNANSRMIAVARDLFDTLLNAV